MGINTKGKSEAFQAVTGTKLQFNAFHKWLLSVPEPVAVAHLAECLASNGEQASELMSTLHGEDWSTDCKNYVHLLQSTIRKLKQESEI